ncbi:MAG: GGDEF domain-containing protein [Clostridia bacterium]|nr:GGDEF domain-containing protein [Clostridia bacterium]
MAIKYGKKQHRKNNILYTIIAAILLCVVFLTMVSYFYYAAEDEAYETLHIQTKQIKDDMELQLLSDRENLATMANFAAKLYSDGESFDLLFKSFEPIGLIENIGILMPDNTFVTKAGTLDLNGRISFEEENLKGEYISGRVKDLTRDNYEIIRSAVPVKANGNTVGILYGVIKLDVIGKKYNNMAKELDAQLFVYDKETGNLVIDTINDKLGNISFLKNRKYRDGYSYEEMINSEKGYTSFQSVLKNEDLYVHFSALEEIDWKITLARYESQVFAKTHITSRLLLVSFIIILLIMALYIMILMRSEKQRSFATACASKIRKLLLEINQQQNNISEALKEITDFAKSRSAVFFDADGEDYNFAIPARLEEILSGKDRKYFISEILRYAAELHKVNNATVSLMCITPNNHLVKTNQAFYDFLKKHKITEVSFATVIDKNNHIGILGVVNPKNGRTTRLLLEDVAVCFSIAFYNKKYLSKTEIAATTDSLTGVSNRVTYKKDLLMFDAEKPYEFSCIYIDVNELHLRNNKYGHAAGDEMLLYVANTLKEVFYGHKIYRMGGDEFLVFAEKTSQDDIKRGIDVLSKQLEPMDYHVAVGMSYRTQNMNTEEMVREAEIRMYEAKAQYYQAKETKKVLSENDNGYVHTKTGILEIDTMISVMKEKYNGIYRVDLDTDRAHRILMPAYLGYNENEEHFSALLTKYIDDSVAPEFHRAMMSFLNYDALKRQLLESKTPRITYKKTNGDTVLLSVYKLSDEDIAVNNTLWVFARD